MSWLHIVRLRPGTYNSLSTCVNLHDGICTFFGQYVLASSCITLCGASSPREVLFGAKSYEMAPYCKASAWNLQQPKYLWCRIYKLGPTVR